MLRHWSAQAKQDFAHAWQWSWSCFSHSVPHASQISAQSAQISFMNGLSVCMALTASVQISAHSLSSRMQPLRSWCALSSRHFVKQWLQASIQSIQASIQASEYCSMVDSPCKAVYGLMFPGCIWKKQVSVFLGNGYVHIPWTGISNVPSNSIVTRRRDVVHPVRRA